MYLELVALNNGGRPSSVSHQDNHYHANDYYPAYLLMQDRLQKKGQPVVRNAYNIYFFLRREKGKA